MKLDKLQHERSQHAVSTLCPRYYINNKIANFEIRVPHVVMHRLYQGVLCFLNVMQFYGTHVNETPLMSIR